MGKHAYRVLIRPLLEGKFGPYVGEVNMAWQWARFKARSFKLGYFAGGFQAFCDGLLARVRGLGVEVLLSAPIVALAAQPASRWRVSPAAGAPRDFDVVIVTGAPGLLSKLAPQLP